MEPEKHLYKILYTDDTYLVIDWTKEEFKKVCNEMLSECKAVATANSLINLTLVRTIVLIPPLPDLTEEEKKEYNSKMKKKTKNMMNEWGFVDQETMNWLEEQGIMDLNELEGIED